MAASQSTFLTEQGFFLAEGEERIPVRVLAHNTSGSKSLIAQADGERIRTRWVPNDLIIV